MKMTALWYYFIGSIEELGGRGQLSRTYIRKRVSLIISLRIILEADRGEA